MKFEFITANRIIFGSGSIREIGSLASSMGKRALVTLGLPKEYAPELIKSLEESNIEAVFFSVSNEPTVEAIQEGLKLAKENACDMVIGYGGGSAIDTGKAIAILLNNPGDIIDYLEVIGKGKALTMPPVPFIAIPTTSGTGAEVTKNAVLGSIEHKVKVSLRSPMMMAKLVIIDPELTFSVPPSVTASTGLDALTQVLEPFVSNAANPITDALCKEGMERAARSLQRAYDNGNDKEAREDMAITSLFGGLALSNAKLGAVHGFAGVLGGLLNAPHGMICAALLPHVISINVQALIDLQPDSVALKRYDEVARILTGNTKATAKDGVAWIQNLCKHLNVSGLRDLGLTPDDFSMVIEKSANASSMKGNPIKLTHEQLNEILTLSL